MFRHRFGNVLNSYFIKVPYAKLALKILENLSMKKDPQLTIHDKFPKGCLLWEWKPTLVFAFSLNAGLLRNRHNLIH